MRTCGVLMPIFSLPSRYGIGTFGKEAKRFVDFLKKAGQTYWQILPLTPTGFGDSPYQSFSAYAGNPYFIDLEQLIEEGLLLQKEVDACDFGDNCAQVDYGKLYEERLPLLKKAYARFMPDTLFTTFCEKNAAWLPDYALFMAIKHAHNGQCFDNWPAPLRRKDPNACATARTQYADTVGFYTFLQFEFYKQWNALKTYANKNGIYFIGDLPIYVAYDSADVWSNPDQFLLDTDGKPTLVAGVPPDAFSADGQLWGNPLYDWKRMKTDGYRWWRTRIAHALTTYDVVRIDHFRGFCDYFAVPYGEKTARNGKWKKGPGNAVFEACKDLCPDGLPIIAEDLGFLTPDVAQMLKNSGFPGMKVLQFAFDSREESDYLPHNYPHNCVVYTGTHDNDTIKGWAQTAPKADVEFARQYMHITDDTQFPWSMMRLALMSVADTCILMMTDILQLDSSARINTPAVAQGNWQWRIDGGCINDWLAKILRDVTAVYSRLPAVKQPEKTV